MGLDAGLSSLDFFVVNFEPFCGDKNGVECPVESRAEHLPRIGAIRLRAAGLRRDEAVVRGE